MTVINMRVSPELVTLLDELRRKEADLPNRSEMLRRCIEVTADVRKVKGRKDTN